MKKLTILSITFISSTLLLISCIARAHRHKSDEIASIGNDIIYTKEVDQRLKKEIYDELYNIYRIRKAKIQELISQKIINLESDKYHITQDSLLKSILYAKLNKESLYSFAKFHHLDTIDIAQQITNHENSHFLTVYRKYRFNAYLDSLKTVYNVRILIQPPLIPNSIDDSILIHYKGNLKSSTTLWILSDPECINCRKAKPLYDSIFNKYKSEIRFALSIYSDNVSLSSLALESASTQGKFWEMYESLNNSDINNDLKGLVTVTKELGLNLGEFMTEMNDSILFHKINQSYKRINMVGIYATPTVIVNNKVISDPSSSEEIENILNYEITEQ